MADPVKPPKLGDPDRTCGTCRFSALFTLDRVCCKRFPPQVQPAKPLDGNAVPLPWTFPVLSRNDYCAEHRAAELEQLPDELDDAPLLPFA